MLTNFWENREKFPETVHFTFHQVRSSKHNLDMILSSGLAEVTPQKFRFLLSTTDGRIGNRSITLTS